MSAARRPSPKLTFTPVGSTMRRMSTCACCTRCWNAAFGSSAPPVLGRLLSTSSWAAYQYAFANTTLRG